MTLLEVVFASAIFLVLLGIAFSFLAAQAQLGKQQQTRAFGAAESQRLYDEVAQVLRASVYDAAGSDLCLNTTTHHFARLKLYEIDRTTPFEAAASGTIPFKLNIVSTQQAILEVVDDAGALVPKTHDASAAGAATGRLRFGIDTDGDDVVDQQVRFLGERVMRFRVMEQGGALVVNLSVKLRTGEGVAVVESAGTTGYVVASKYDSNIMQ